MRYEDLMKREWLLIALYMPFLKPDCLVVVPALDSLFDIWRVASLCAILLLYLWRGRLSLPACLIILFESSLLFSTILHQGDYWKLAVSCGSVIGVCILTELSIKVDPRRALHSLYVLCALWTWINFFTLFLFPNGMYEDIYTQNYFLGYYNSFIVVLLPGVCLGVLLRQIEGKKPGAQVWLLFAACAFTIFKMWSATSIIGILMLSVYLLFFCGKERFAGLMNMRTYLLCAAALFTGIILLRVQDAFSFIIVDLLHKDLTFTGRTFIWDRALAYFWASPVFGWGIENDALISLKIGAFHAHNYYLDLMYKGGLAAILLFTALLMVCSVLLMRLQHEPMARTLSFVLFDFLIMLQVESYQYMPLFFVLITIACHLDSLKAERPVQAAPLVSRYLRTAAHSRKTPILPARQAERRSKYIL